MRTTSAIVALALMGCTAVSAAGIRAAQMDSSSRSLGEKGYCVELDEATIPVAPDTEFAALPHGYSNCNGNPKGSSLVQNMFYATQNSLKMRTVQPHDAQELYDQVCDQQLKFHLTCQNTPYGDNKPACVKVDIECDLESESSSSEDEEGHGYKKSEGRCYETTPDEVMLGKANNGEKRLAQVKGFENCNIYN